MNVVTKYKKSLLKEGLVVINASPQTDQELLDLAMQLGTVIPGAREEMVQYLPAREKGEGPVGSFSHIVGYDCFPWHTDTAYWEVPTRYLLLFSPVASPCATTYQSFESIKASIPDFDYLMDRAVFLLDVPGQKRYLSPHIRKENEVGYRLDFHIYRPMNYEAAILQDLVSDYLSNNHLKHMWTGKDVIVLDNWKYIHAREDAHNDQARVLKRIYINELV